VARPASVTRTGDRRLLAGAASPVRIFCPQDYPRAERRSWARGRRRTSWPEQRRSGAGRARCEARRITPAPTGRWWRSVVYPSAKDAPASRRRTSPWASLPGSRRVSAASRSSGRWAGRGRSVRAAMGRRRSWKPSQNSSAYWPLSRVMCTSVGVAPNTTTASRGLSRAFSGCVRRREGVSE
jgi:hypothetical protein